MNSDATEEILDMLHSAVKLLERELDPIVNGSAEKERVVIKARLLRHLNARIELVIKATVEPTMTEKREALDVLKMVSTFLKGAQMCRSADKVLKQTKKN